MRRAIGNALAYVELRTRGPTSVREVVLDHAQV